MAEPMFKPGDKVVAHYEHSDDSTFRQRGFFWMMDETGLMLKGRTGQPDLIFIPANRLVMIESETLSA